MPETNNKEVNKKYKKVKKLVQLKRKLQKEMFNHEDNLIIKHEGNMKRFIITNPLSLNSDGNATRQSYSEDSPRKRKGISSRAFTYDYLPAGMLMQFPPNPLQTNIDKGRVETFFK